MPDDRFPTGEDQLQGQNGFQQRHGTFPPGKAPLRGGRKDLIQAVSCQQQAEYAPYCADQRQRIFAQPTGPRLPTAIISKPSEGWR